MENEWGREGRKEREREKGSEIESDGREGERDLERELE